MKRPRPTSTRPNASLWLAAALALSPCSTLAQVPGMVHTESGYDNLAGEDAICWSAEAYHPSHQHQSEELKEANFQGMHWENALVPDFIAGPTDMLASCPSGTALSLDLHQTSTHGSAKLRTHQYYTFHFTLDIDLNSIRQQFDLSENAFFYSHKAQSGKTGVFFPQIALQLDFCPINGNLCSPFMFEGLMVDNLNTLKVGNVHNRGEGRGHHFGDQGDVIELSETNVDHDHEDHGHNHRDLETEFTIIATPEEEEEEHPNESQPEDHPPHEGLNQPDNDHSSHSHDDQHDEDDHSSHGHDDNLQDDHSSHSHPNDNLDEKAKNKLQEHTQGAASSPEFYIEIANTGNQSVFQIHYDVEIQVQDAGDYIPMATVLFFLTNDTVHGHTPHGMHEMALYKIDMANLLHDRSVTFYDPVEINEVSTAAEVTSYVLIGICAIIQIFFLASTIRYRNENVLQLSQVSFLIALQGASLVAIVSSVFYRPFSNWACYLGGPLTMIPLQLIFAIVFGRLRRIYSIMAPLLSFNSTTANKRYMRRGLRNWKTVMMMRPASSSDYGKSSRTSSNNTPSTEEGGEDSPQESAPATRTSWMLRIPFLQKCFAFNPKNSLKRQFSETRLWILVCLVTLPMVVWEICLIIFCPPELNLVLNEEESEGRYMCGTESAQKYQLVSTAILFVTMMLDLYQAQSSKTLPAFFNEASAVSNGLAIAVLIMAVGFAVLIVSAGPEGEPDLTYLMEVLIVLCTALNLSIRLTLPKLKLIWRGEKVVVSRLLQSHRESTIEKSQVNGPQISGLDVPGSSNPCGPQRMEEGSESTTNAAGESDVSHDDCGDLDRSANRRGAILPSIDEDKIVAIQPEQAKSPRKRIVVHPRQAPPSKLTVQLLSHTNRSQHVNEKVLAGYQVESADWRKLEESVDEFQALLRGYEFPEITNAD